MTEQEYRDAEFRNLGFRCIEPTRVQFLDGAFGTVRAHSYLSSKEIEYPNSTERQKRAWKIYSIIRENQQSVETIDELALEQIIGDAFIQLN